MSMNMPENVPQQPVSNEVPVVEDTAQEVVTPNDVTVDASQTEVVPPEQAQATPEQEQQVIDTVAEGLANEEISAIDIVAALASEAFGLSPAGGYALAEMFKNELQDEDTDTGLEDVDMMDVQVDESQE